MGGERCMDASFSDTCGSWRSTCRSPARQHIDKSSPLRVRRKGRARSGNRHQPRRPKHQSPRIVRRPRTANRVRPDWRSGGGLPRRGPAAAVGADRRIGAAYRGYDTNVVRHAIEERGATPNIPPKISRKWKPCFSPVLYRARNCSERMFGRLKDFRRVATTHDKLAANFLAAIHLVAAVCYWL